jgi:hypothetical protein
MGRLRARLAASQLIPGSEEVMQPEMMQSKLPQPDLASPRTERPLSGTAPSPLEPIREQLDALLRQTLSALAVGGATRVQIRKALRPACDAAHERGLHAEQLLILVKNVWHELPATRRATREDAERLLARVITLCVDEYYALDRGP